MDERTRSSPRPGGYAQAIRGDRLQNFLYLLLRDHLPAGVVEAMVCDCEVSVGGEVAFSNDFTAAYAVELSARLRGAALIEALEAGHNAIRHAQAQGEAG